MRSAILLLMAIATVAAATAVPENLGFETVTADGGLTGWAPQRWSGDDPAQVTVESTGAAEGVRAVSVAVEIVFFWTQGRWFARLGASAWLTLAAAVCVLRFSAMALLGGSAWVLVFAQSLHALTFTLHRLLGFNGREFARGPTRQPRGPLRGRGQALYTTLGYGASGVIGGVAGGAISERFGLQAVFGAAALVSLGALICCWRSQTLARRATL